MTELRGSLLVDGRLSPGVVRVDGARIAAVELEDGPARPNDPVVAPGLVDLHVHGYGGHGPVDDLRGMARALARDGTTAFQPTLFPARPAELGEVAASVARAADELAAGGEPCARALGAHLEGPFVNPVRAGALPREDLVEPSPEALRALLGSATGDGRGIRTVTLAPELPGADALVAELVRCGIRVSLGHSDADEARATAAARAGAAGVTHLYNAMAPLHHRAPGLAGVALTEDVLFAELIGDRVHVGDRAIELALAARGPGGLCLVSDALAGAGTGCEVFEACGRSHVVRGGAAWYPAGPDGTPERLAGSALGQLDAVRGLVAAGTVSLEEALTMASTTPARALGLEGELGVLSVGRWADLIVLEPSEGLPLRGVTVGGRPVPGAGGPRAGMHA